MKRALLVLAACGSSTPSTAPIPQSSHAEPTVDMTCVERARGGNLLNSLPVELDGFHVTAATAGVHLHRVGRELTHPEADRLWGLVGKDVFAAGGLAMGNGGHDSVYTCDDAPKNNCLKLRVWICQVDLPTLTARLHAAAEDAGVADAMITVDVAFEEIRGPSCHDGAACTPTAHYSVKGAYDPSRPRHAETGHSGGVCRDDGDCEGARSNDCVAWYLRGGSEDAIEILRDKPAFCGCIARRCSWFTQ